ncbi:DUF488 domain-containing protein [Acetobacter farinalis]|uniref:DUF488 domain-containing protein n=1 Tax=Acetobacter farinalis TaxID=1260984 RepID=A0ABT3Q961_9PROT|nr:DUF488 domain-containing protein [Acetobacter farinalis]MCX2561832.1 DUF488 domain-containing protein [Acetobacter farinalis]NHO30323.1 DUF488 family protein [Acetobacter farinalis]
MKESTFFEESAKSAPNGFLHPFYTIGHSTHPLDVFIALLQHYGVTFIADIRAFPYSRRNRDYDGSHLVTTLGEQGIGYEHFPALGGRRPRSKTVDPHRNAFWRVQSFHNYADYALGAEFHTGLVQLMEKGRTETVALMCAEVLWWRCHRRIVTDYLLANDVPVFHILSLTEAQPALLTPSALLVDGGGIVYPASPEKEA